MAIERAWWTRVRDCRLYCYHLPAETFECLDEGAGYFVSRVPVGVRCAEVIADAIGALLARGVELRLLPTLWPLRDAIVRSSLQYSMIRLRNAGAAMTSCPYCHRRAMPLWRKCVLGPDTPIACAACGKAVASRG